MKKFFNSGLFRLLLIIVPPIILGIFSLFYFTKFYKNDFTIVSTSDNNSEITKVVFDPLSIRDLLPNSLGSVLKFKLCLKNNNVVSVPEGAVLEKTSGAMSVHSTGIETLNLYKEVGEFGCVSVDPEKLISSKVTSDVNVGPVIIDIVSVDDQVELKINRSSTDLTKTFLYLRMEWNYFFLLLFSMFVAWLGFALLIVQTYKFIKFGGRE